MFIQPLTEGNYFHIYNRGVNGEDLFKEETLYTFFLEKYRLYCGEVFDTLAYCMMQNHFHLLLRINRNVYVPRHEGKGVLQLNASKQLGHLFNSFAQTVNFRFKRTGPLFESPFERKEVDSEEYITRMIMYCHSNPVHHGFTQSTEEWPHSSYHAIQAKDDSLVKTGEVLRLFGGMEGFKTAHKEMITEEWYWIEK